MRNRHAVPPGPDWRPSRECLAPVAHVNCASYAHVPRSIDSGPNAPRHHHSIAASLLVKLRLRP